MFRALVYFNKEDEIRVSLTGKEDFLQAVGEVLLSKEDEIRVICFAEFNPHPMDQGDYKILEAIRDAHEHFGYSLEGLLSQLVSACLSKPEILEMSRLAADPFVPEDSEA